jgi:hypothetical protein
VGSKSHHRNEEKVFHPIISLLLRSTPPPPIKAACRPQSHKGLLASKVFFFGCFLLDVSFLVLLPATHHRFFSLETVQVDVENPFNNGRVAVFPLMGIKGSNGVDEHQGYAIALPFDKRPVLLDRETLKVQARITFKNEIVISGLPAEVGFCGLLYHGAKTASEIWQNSTAWEDEDCEWLRDGLTHGVNNFLSDETRFFTRTREIHLIFPKNVELNVACFKTQGNVSDKGWSETLPLRNIYLSNEPRDGHELDSNSEVKDKSLLGSTPYIFFIVAREDTKSYKRMKAATKPRNFADNFL